MPGTCKVAEAQKLFRHELNLFHGKLRIRFANALIFANYFSGPTSFTAHVVFPALNVQYLQFCYCSLYSSDFRGSKSQNGISACIFMCSTLTMFLKIFRHCLQVPPGQLLNHPQLRHQGYICFHPSYHIGFQYASGYETCMCVCVLYMKTRHASSSSVSSRSFLSYLPL